MSDGMNRRKFLKVLGVTGGGAAALAGCSTDHVEKLIPYLVPVEDQIPGIATYYASTCRECAAGCGVHVRVREGRAIKLEGNPENPINQGRLCTRAQTALQGTYNPDRIQGPMAKGADGTFKAISWDDAIARVATALDGVSGDKVWFLSGDERGSFAELVDEWLRALGSSHHVTWEAFGYEAARYANRALFGLDALPTYAMDQAKYVLSFGADFLETWHSPIAYAREFTQSHAFRNGTMGRYVHVEPRMSMTGMSADEWLPAAAGSEGAVALAMANVIMSEKLGATPADARRFEDALKPYTPESAATRSGLDAERIRRIAREFAAGPSVALPGGVGTQHPDAHATAAAVMVLNYVAGNVGKTVVFGAGATPAGGSSYTDLVNLVEAMKSGGVQVLLVHGANPVFAAPQSLKVADALGKVKFKVSFARFMDETATACDLILPDHDPYEQWNDFEPRDGVHLLQQPVMEPVFQTRQTGDVLIDVARKAGGDLQKRFAPASPDTATYKDYLQGRWNTIQRTVGNHDAFDTFWRNALKQGGVWTTPHAQPVRLVSGAAQVLATAPWAPPKGKLTLIAYPSSTVYDGRGANRPWLQETPDPVTKMTWGSWVEIHPETAEHLGFAEGDIVDITSDLGTVRVQVYVYPGLRPDVIAMPTGQGHTAYGRYAKDRGANVYALLDSKATVFGGVSHYAAVTLEATGVHVYPATTEGSSRQLDRGIAQAITLAAATKGDYRAWEAQEAAPIPQRVQAQQESWEEHVKQGRDYGPYKLETTRWGMSIDLSRCTGCSACVTACFAENNLPAVGPDLVRQHRQMHWMRIERYFEGGGDKPLESRFVPMLCQQCGNAPCEPVCPVFAAYHTPDGLNGQVYNRCVGTRYCSNNCPYKVRYFNWFDYSAKGDPYFAWPEPMNWLLNPDVTVRGKGVMEKCTFCIQRIRGAQHEAKLKGVPLKDGDILTACQQTCPTEAIVFGNLTDPGSRVSLLSEQRRGYKVLEGLNTRPAVTYLEKVRNVVEA